MLHLLNIILILFTSQPDEDWYIIKAMNKNIGYVNIKTKVENNITVMEEITKMKRDIGYKEVYFAVKFENDKIFKEYIYKVTQDDSVTIHCWGRADGNLLQTMKKAGDKSYIIQSEIPDDYKPLHMIFKEISQNFEPGKSVSYSAFQPDIAKFGKVTYTSVKAENLKILGKSIKTYLIEEKSGDNITERWINKDGKLIRSYNDDFDFEIILSEEKICAGLFN